MEARDSFCFPKNTKNPNPSPIGKSSDFVDVVPVVGVEPTRVISTRDFESPSSAIPTHRRM